MSEFLTYKKLSDLEEVNTTIEGATIPVLDGDGVVKRISAKGIGSDSAGNPVVFIISKNSDGNKVLFDREGVREATAKEVFDAYFANNAYVEAQEGNELTPQKITGFFISGGGHGGQALWTSNSAGFGYELTQSEIGVLARSYY